MNTHRDTRRDTGEHAPDCGCRVCNDATYNVPHMGESLMLNDPPEAGWTLTVYAAPQHA